jgi:hypothetical protein
MLIKIIWLVGLSLALSACESATSSENVIEKGSLLTVNESPSLNHDIKRQDLPMGDQIKLYNLDAQLHDSTLSALRSLLEQQHQPQSQLNWNLQNPKAPQPRILTSPSWIEGQASLSPETIQLDILCSYASYPCSKLMFTLQEITQLMTGPYQIRFYDFPQSFHHLGFDAAAAVQCIEATAKEKLKQYLWIQNGQLDIAGLKGAINLYSASPKNTFKCMDNPETTNTIEQGIGMLEQSGFNKTPSVLLNGQYLTRGKEEQLIVQTLLPNLDVPTANQFLDSTSGLHWLESWGKRDAVFSWALVEYQNKVIRVTPGDKLGDAFVAHITHNNMSVIKDGQLHWLNNKPKQIVEAQSPLMPDVKNQQYSQAASIDHDNNLLATESSQSANDEYLNDKQRFEKMIQSVKTQPLPQSWLEQQLMRQTELEESLNLTENKMEGKSLVKLNPEDIDEFYTSLGMQPGDVILRVNGQWIHEENNSLFQSLANEESVTVSVMRNGLPVHFSFVIEN